MSRNRLQSQLSRATALFRGVSHIVVSDEYPPDTVGGAEISLHEQLKGSFEDRNALLVVRFSAKHEDVHVYRYEGIDVLVLPRQANWWNPKRTRADYKALAKRVKLAPALDAYQHAQLLLRFRKRGLRACILLQQALSPPSGAVIVEPLPEMFQLQAHLLNYLIAKLSPRVILMNNTRSIVTGYRARLLDPRRWSSLLTVAYVRDNRFACARHNQLMRVRSADCTICNFECSRDDGKRFPSIQRDILAETRAQRHAALRSYDTVLVTSNFLRDQISRETSIEAQVLPNPVGDRSQIEAFLEGIAQSEEHIIAVVGSLSEAKGQLEFINASIQILRKHPRIRVHLIGRGDRMKQRIQKILREEKLEKSVRFRGFLGRRELYEELRMAKVIGLPTLWPEPFGRVPLEAAACGRPVVAFATGGLPELIEDNVTGLLVKKGDYGAFWKSAMTLFHDGQLSRQLAVNAANALWRRFDERLVWARMRDLISIPRVEQEETHQ